MINVSRIDIYNYVKSVLTKGGIKNIYLMNMPKKIPQAVEEAGFSVITLGQIRDRSQFTLKGYAECFAYIDIYIKSLTNTTLNQSKYKELDELIRKLVMDEADNKLSAFKMDSDVMISDDSTDEQRGYHILHVEVKITTN